MTKKIFDRQVRWKYYIEPSIWYLQFQISLSTEDTTFIWLDLLYSIVAAD